MTKSGLGNSGNLMAIVRHRFIEFRPKDLTVLEPERGEKPRGIMPLEFV